MHPAHKTFRAKSFSLKAKFFLVSQEEGLQVSGRVSYCTLAKRGTGLGGTTGIVLQESA